MNWAEFFSMGGRGAFVWGSFGVFALGIALEVLLLRARAVSSTGSKEEK
ncbi:MAG: heme exporter protein CcmD [Betaproteobacteria bacterium]|nr:heme exporter protein CcmD [Betaproteobacteria bacterium]